MVAQSVQFQSHGKRLYSKFNSLSNTDKTLCCLCLNGILDPTNGTEAGQKQLFTEEQWSYMEKVLRSNKTKHLVKASCDTENVIKKIIKVCLMNSLWSTN